MSCVRRLSSPAPFGTPSQDIASATPTSANATSHRGKESLVVFIEVLCMLPKWQLLISILGVQALSYALLWLPLVRKIYFEGQISCNI